MTDIGCHGAAAPPAERGTEPGGVRIALAGNPNVGKSSLFNQLTGAHQHVGNWPGKTVERRSGTCRRGPVPLTVIDLPGTYSLASSSPEEVVAEEALLGEGVDVVAVVLDSATSRSLYLAAQAAELGRPLVLVLNMADRAAAEGLRIDDATLASALDAAVVRTVGRTGEGIDELVDVLTLSAREVAGNPALAWPIPAPRRSQGSAR